MTTIILVVDGEPRWTQQAVHLAGAMARESGAEVLILEMVPVARLEYLGAGLREPLLNYATYETLHEHVATIQAYGVAATVSTYEFTDYISGLCSAAEQISPLAVFAPAPRATLRALAALRLWRLRRGVGCPLYTLGPGEPAAVLVTAPTERATPEARPARSSLGAR